MTLNHHAQTLPDCAPCWANKHDECVPIVSVGAREKRSVVCGCFAAHPDSEEHENALFWWGGYASVDTPAEREEFRRAEG